MNPAIAPIIRVGSGHHGAVRGADLSRRSSQFEGRFGRMFRTLPAAEFNESILLALSEAMTASADTPTPEDQADDEENTGISAGYTYLGQFIDHDLTFDPASSLERQNDPDGLVDYRTPRFDLDCVYGRGPADQPYLYRDDGLHMLLGDPLTGNDKDHNARGLPRNRPEPNEPARALIGDPRNDENVIVSQLQSAMLRFHNRVVDLMGDPPFEEAQRMVRWHYQWAVIHDFLPTIIGEDTWHDILPHIAKRTNVLQDPPRLNFYQRGGVSVWPFDGAADLSSEREDERAFANLLIYRGKPGRFSRIPVRPRHRLEPVLQDGTGAGSRAEAHAAGV
jgi:Animal haem peroxidase